MAANSLSDLDALVQESTAPLPLFEVLTKIVIISDKNCEVCQQAAFLAYPVVLHKFALKMPKSSFDLKIIPVKQRVRFCPFCK
jgi:hypothetical protein